MPISSVVKDLCERVYPVTTLETVYAVVDLQKEAQIFILSNYRCELFSLISLFFHSQTAVRSSFESLSMFPGAPVCDGAIEVGKPVGPIAEHPGFSREDPFYIRFNDGLLYSVGDLRVITVNF